MEMHFRMLASACGWDIVARADPRIKVNILRNARRVDLGRFENFRGVHLIRDPRDVVVSGYYSHLKSHETSDWPQLQEHRRQLKAVRKQEGLALEMKFSRAFIENMIDWDYGDDSILELRYEDFTSSPNFELLWDFLEVGGADPDGSMAWFAKRNLNRASNRAGFGPLFWTIRCPRKILDNISEALEFERLSGGRPRGSQDSNSHFRKGVAGDWVDEFDDGLKAEFKTLFPGALEKLGYESNDDW